MALALLAVVGTAAAAVNPALIEHVGNSWYITPANDIDIDGDDLTWVTNQAQPGDTLVLRAGTFWLGKTGSYTYTVVLPVPGSPSFTMTVGFQVFVIDKRLTLVGETDADGNVLTTITTHLSPNSHFKVSAVGVTFRGLRFYEVMLPIHTLAAGTTVDHCVFEDSGQYEVFYPSLELRTVYPHYVPTGGNPAADPSYPFDFTDPVKTYFTNNVLINCEYGIWGYGSEMVVTGNRMECRQYAIYLTPGWELAHRARWTMLEAGILQNNVIRDNAFSGQLVHQINVCLAAYWTGILRNNEVTHNSFTDVFHGVEFYAYTAFGPSIVASNTVAHNRFATDKGCTLVASYWPTHENFLVSNNLFQKAGRWVVLFWATLNSAIVGNNMQNIELLWQTPNEAHVTLDTCERTTVVGESKKLSVVELGGSDNVFVGVNNKKGAGGVGQRICSLMSDPELKGWAPGQHQDAP
jgi:hypothetical protein